MFSKRSSRCAAILASVLCTSGYGALPISAQAPAQVPAVPTQDAGSGGSLADATRLANTGHSSEALALLDRMRVGPQPDPGVERVRGIAYYNAGKLREADSAFAKALQRDPQDKEAAQMRGLTLFRLGRPADAIPLLAGNSEAAAQTKADPSYVLALCYMDTRRYDDARHAFAKQYGFAPDSAAAYLFAARMLFRREFVPVAQEFASEASRRDSQMPLVNELLGEIALAGNHLDEAIAYFDKERQRNPLEPSVYERLGDALTRAARYPEARISLQRAILLEPNSTGPYILLGKVSLKENDPVAALTYLQRGEQMDPANFMTHNLLAQAYRAVGRTADATRELQLTERTQHADTPKAPAQQ